MIEGNDGLLAETTSEFCTWGANRAWKIECRGYRALRASRAEAQAVSGLIILHTSAVVVFGLAEQLVIQFNLIAPEFFDKVGF